MTYSAEWYPRRKLRHAQGTQPQSTFRRSIGIIPPAPKSHRPVMFQHAMHKFYDGSIFDDVQFNSMRGGPTSFRSHPALLRLLHFPQQSRVYCEPLSIVYRLYFSCRIQTQNRDFECVELSHFSKASDVSPTCFLESSLGRCIRNFEVARQLRISNFRLNNAHAARGGYEYASKQTCRCGLLHPQRYRYSTT